MKKLFTLLLILGFLSLQAQVTFIVDSLPDYTPPEDDLYIAGDFNGWNAGDPAYMMQKNAQDLWEITLNGFSNGETIEFKFTRGDWATVEKDPKGEEMENRSFTFGNGETVYVKIYNWADNNGGGGSTAAENVTIMDEDFYMPQLDRYRRIWVYLPPDYEDSQDHYPVLYMHDGQNLFDVETSFLGEWEVDETLNDLADQGYQVPIVVGIDNDGQHRANEYLPYYNPNFAGGEGDEYMAFIVETLKPHIDENYRTLDDRENTGIMGSSLGGVISLYGALKYQDVFSKSGPFSPAYWANYDSLWPFISETGLQQDIRFYQNAGEYEGWQYIDRMYQMEDSLNIQGFQNVSSKVIEGGDHNEETWAGDFADAYLWLFNTYATKLEEKSKTKPLQIFPNPVRDQVRIKTDVHMKGVSVMIFGITGNLKMKTNTDLTDGINVSGLPPGIYLLRLRSEEQTYTGRFVKY
ncbi:MAG: T9SS type A sorting domain-containing protein [Bacteroidales bacterium]|nr:T9SS type A sorting domain-containing protein [Bacteroidales bacterium]